MRWLTRPGPISTRNDARLCYPDAARSQRRCHRLCSDHRARPCGNPLEHGPGRSRFSSPKDKFHLLYLAQDPTTAFAETIVRDRYEKSAERLLLEEELDRYSIPVVRNPRPLFLLDLRNEGASLLGISTDAVRALRIVLDRIPQLAT
ncbi:RES domain-containing protein [Mesorhizobium sp. M0220]|uniref:RES domain-containing protein n=1 Tax=Mesorhizobium sp. M0220 TaxID=2956920 RepID=UPI0033395422